MSKFTNIEGLLYNLKASVPSRGRSRDQRRAVIRGTSQAVREVLVSPAVGSQKGHAFEAQRLAVWSLISPFFANSRNATAALGTRPANFGGIAVIIGWICGLLESSGTVTGTMATAPAPD